MREMYQDEADASGVKDMREKRNFAIVFRSHTPGAADRAIEILRKSLEGFEPLYVKESSSFLFVVEMRRMGKGKGEIYESLEE